MTRHHQDGNAVIMILVAVALFAALGFTFLKGGQQGIGNMSAQQASMAAQDIVAYANKMENAFNRLRQKGCSETEFDFSNNVWKLANGSYIFPAGHNTKAASGCGLFVQGEGGMTAAVMPENYNDPTYTPTGVNTMKGHFRILRVTMPSIGTTNEDLVLNFPIVNKALCMALNDIAGVENPGDNPPNATTNSGAAEFNGVWTTTGTFVEDAALTGKPRFCFKSSGFLRYYHTILVR